MLCFALAKKSTKKISKKLDFCCNIFKSKNVIIPTISTISCICTIHFCVCMLLLSYKILSIRLLPDHVTWGSPNRSMVLTSHRNSTTHLPDDVKSMVFQNILAALQKYQQIRYIMKCRSANQSELLLWRLYIRLGTLKTGLRKQLFALKSNTHELLCKHNSI